MQLLQNLDLARHAHVLHIPFGEVPDEKVQLDSLLLDWLALTDSACHGLLQLQVI